MRDTLLLDADAWDLTLDSFGNIAMANAPYAAAQDVASACRLWKGEARYDTRRGVPYEQSILGQQVPSGTLASWLEGEATTNPDVSSAAAILQQQEGRALGGQIQLTLTDGTTYVLGI